MSRRLWLACVACALWISSGCGGGDAAPPPAASGGAAAPTPVVTGPPPTEMPTQPTVTDVFALVPDTATGGVVIRVPKLLASPFAKSDATAKLKEEMLAKTGMNVDQVNEVVLVFTGQGGSGYPTGSPYVTGPPRTERVTGPPTGSPYGPGVTGPPADASQPPGADMAAAMMPSPDSFLMIVRATAPLDQAKLREVNKIQPTEVEVGQFKMLRPTEATGPSMCFFDDQTLVLANEGTLQTILGQAGASSSVPYGPAGETAAPAAKKLGDKLREAAPELALFGTMKFANLQLGAMPAAAPGIPPGMNPSDVVNAMAQKMPSGALSLDFTTGAKVVLDLEAANNDAAQEIWVQMQSLPAILGPMVAMQKGQNPPGATEEQKALRAKGFEAWDQFSKTLKVERGGEGNLHVLMSGSLDQPMIESLAGMMKKDVFLTPGSQQAKMLVSTQMKEVGLAAHSFLSEKGKLPTAAILAADGKPLLSWRVMLLPYLGQKELYDQFKLDEAWDSEHNKALIEKMPGVYSMPGVKDPGKTTLLAPIGDGTVFGHKEGATFAIASDGASNTVMLVEANIDRAVTWTAPEDLKYVPGNPVDGIDKVYPGVFHALWMDGQVHDIALNTDKATMAGLFTFAGGETIDMSALIAAAANAPTTVAVAAAGDAPASVGGESGYAADAKQALDRGQDKEAARLALAAAIVLDDTALADQTMHWSKLNRPVPFLRWGVGVMPDPTRRPETNSGAPGATASPYGRPGDAAASTGEEVDSEKEFYDLTSDVGRDMVREIRDRLDDGDFGKVFEFDRKKSDDPNASGQIDQSMRVETRNPYGPTGPNSSASADPSSATTDEMAEKAPRGLVFLGKGDKKKLQEAAEEAEVDLMLVAKMTTKNNRSTDPAVAFYVVDVATKKVHVRESDPLPLPAGAGANSFGSTGPSTGSSASADDEARRKNKAKWMKVFEEAVKFKEIPSLPEDLVLKRATKIVGTGKHDHPLPLLLELRFYVARGVLPEDAALPLVEKILGDADQAKAILSGTEEERKNVLKPLLLEVPKAEPKSDS